MIALRYRLAQLVAVLVLGPGAALAWPASATEDGPAGAGPLVPRVVVVLYDGRFHQDVRATPSHTMAEMPLNHLGLRVRYHDVNLGVPDVLRDPDVRGVLTWFTDPLRPQLNYHAWVEALLAAGKRLVILGNVGIDEDVPLLRVNELLRPIGARFQERYVNATYDVSAFSADPAVIGFEREFLPPFPPYRIVRAIEGEGTALLTLRKIRRAGLDSDVVLVGPQGGFVEQGYTHFGELHEEWAQWHIEPFEFFRLAFATDDLPKLDTTTLSGRRIYYSHIDGDGWRNLSELEEYRGQKVTSADVVMRKAIAPYPDLPVSVAPVTADLDLEWYGSAEELRVAREVLALPQVEAASHTHTHPFRWQFFENYTASKEAIFLPRYRDLASDLERTKALYSRSAPGVDSSAQDYDIGTYNVPRAYAMRPFSLAQEIKGSIDFINDLLPSGKRVELLQWSGNTSPFPDAMAAARSAGVRNINGGDARIDPDYPSIAWVTALGLQSGPFVQVYASNSNENTYTHLWRGRFYGFRYLPETVNRTESPRRIKPVNVYYHMYSGQKTASLKALLDNLEFVRTLSIAPVSASRFAGIAEGFFSARIVKLGSDRWQIVDRDLLQTVRFDDAAEKNVDYGRSAGVLGDRKVGDVLYVALDEAHEAPIVALGAPAAPVERPVLVEARWRVFGLEIGAGGFQFDAQGFGEGEMLWQVAPDTRYRLESRPDDGQVTERELVADGSGYLRVTVAASPNQRVRLTLRRMSSGT